MNQPPDQLLSSVLQSMHRLEGSKDDAISKRLVGGVSELFWETHIGLCKTSSMDAPFNDEIVEGVLEAYRCWIARGGLADAPSFRWFATALHPITSRQMVLCRSAPDGLLRAAPIGLHYSSDATRAYELAARISAVIDADAPTAHATGVVAMLAALLATGSTLQDAIQDAGQFLLPFEDASVLPDLLLNGQFSSVHFSRHPAIATLGGSLEELTGSWTPDIPTRVNRNPIARLLSAQLRGLINVCLAS